MSSSYVKNPPKKIYLNFFLEPEDEEVDFDDLCGVTWCKDPVDVNNAIGYVEASEFERLKADLEYLKTGISIEISAREKLEAENERLKSFLQKFTSFIGMGNEDIPDFKAKARELLTPKE